MAVGISTPINAICAVDPVLFHEEDYRGHSLRAPAYRGKTWPLDWSCGRQHPDFKDAELVSDIVSVSVGITNSNVQDAIKQAKQDDAQARDGTEKEIAALGIQIADL